MASAVPLRVDASDPETRAKALAAFEELGAVIVTGVLDEGACKALVEEVQRVEREHDIAEGKSEFEGFHTRRIFNLIGKSALFRDLVIHPEVLEIVEGILADGFLLSGTTSMNIGPSETPQLLHADDGMITLPRPHPATMMTTMWALSEFRAENGATCWVPGSHNHPAMPRPGEEHDVEYAEMPAGSVLFLHGSLWHGGGANQTADERRYGLSIQYVSGWCRQQQNLMLGTAPEVVAGYPRRLQELIGYSMFRNVMGHVDRRHPLSLLGIDEEPQMVWEKMAKD